MNYVSWEISVIALLPALFLCVFVYWKDRIEKEPIGLLVLLFFVGAAVYYPTLAAERFLSGGIDFLFADAVIYAGDGSAQYTSPFFSVLHKILNAFFGVSLVETLFKFGALFVAVRKNKHFNYLFDGVVYSVFLSLGFAAAENVRFAWINGWETLLMRSLSTVPLHLFVGVLMGYYFSRWRTYRAAKDLETEMLLEKRITEEKLGAAWVRLVPGFLVPFFLCAVFILSGSIRSQAMRTLFFFVLFLLYGLSFISVNRIASQDNETSRFSEKILREKHPELTLSAKKEGEGSDNA